MPERPRKHQAATSVRGIFQEAVWPEAATPTDAPRARSADGPCRDRRRSSAKKPITCAPPPDLLFPTLRRVWLATHSRFKRCPDWPRTRANSSSQTRKMPRTPCARSANATNSAIPRTDMTNSDQTPLPRHARPSCFHTMARVAKATRCWELGPALHEACLHTKGGAKEPKRATDTTMRK